MIEDISMKDLLAFFDEKIALGGKLRRRATTAAREPSGRLLDECHGRGLCQQP